MGSVGSRRADWERLLIVEGEVIPSATRGSIRSSQHRLLPSTTHKDDLGVFTGGCCCCGSQTGIRRDPEQVSSSVVSKAKQGLGSARLRRKVAEVGCVIAARDAKLLRCLDPPPPIR